MGKFAFDPPSLELDNPHDDDEDHGGGLDAFKSFHIKRGGQNIGELHTESYGKRVDINNVEVYEGHPKLGPSHVRHLARQLKEHFPEMETVGGFRVSGARRKNNKPIEVKLK